MGYEQNNIPPLAETWGGIYLQDLQKTTGIKYRLASFIAHLSVNGLSFARYAYNDFGEYVYDKRQMSPGRINLNPFPKDKFYPSSQPQSGNIAANQVSRTSSQVDTLKQWALGQATMNGGFQ